MNSGSSILTDSIVIGANSGIAQALVNKLISIRGHVVAISRCDCPENIAADNLTWIKTEYDQESLNLCAHRVDTLIGDVQDIYICHGVLHHEGKMPEKKLEDLDADYLQQFYLSNAITPLLWLQQLLPLLKKQKNTYVTVFSARVGSISDNRLGGWYGYRASKAALNMMLKTASIELKRRAKGVKLIAFHPGTTDTPLSKPFQTNVSSDKLFSPEFVASQLLDIQQSLELDGELSYVDWQGELISY